MNRTISTAAKTFTCSGTVKDVRDGEVEHPIQYVPVTMVGDGKPVIAAEKMGVASCPNKLWKLMPKVSSTQGVTVANLAQGPADAHIQSVWGVRAENGGSMTSSKERRCTACSMATSLSPRTATMVVTGFCPAKGAAVTTRLRLTPTDRMSRQGTR